MQVQGTVWEELSHSSKNALRWAGAMARLRADRTGGPSEGVEADEFDVLVGVMLSHPGNSEPRQLFAHIGASAADVLPPDYPIPGSDLEQYGGRVPADRPPDLTGPAGQAVQLAAGELRGSAKVVELKALFGGLLYGSNALSSAVRDLFGRVGLTGAVEGYRDYLADPSASDYADFLTRVFPFRAAPVEVPDYKADTSVTGDDLVDIRAEVDAFAYLLASRSLKPPLAVGLFGDWGSGKTFFMQSVRNRIVQLAGSPEALETPQSALPFWKRIAQIDFNAWHYVEGDLWASLVEHVFSELRVNGDRDDSELAKRQKHWLDQIEAKRRERLDVVGELDEKRRAQNKAQAKLERAQKHKRKQEEELDRRQQEAMAELQLDTSKKAVKDAVAAVADRVTDGNATETLDAISKARAQLQRGTVALGAYPWNRWKSLIVLAGLLAIPVLVLVLDQVHAIPVTAQVFAGISAALALVTAGLRSVTAWAKGRLDELDKAEAAVKAEIEEQRQKLREGVRAAETALAEANAEVEELSGRDRVLDREIAALEIRAKSVTSGQILGEFVAERVGSTDYRKLLGTAALIQRDFDELSKLIEEQNEEFLEKDKGHETPSPETLNRIILYIDDLDRCEPKRVVEVLQAVHLLLAFPLFVVVVAVDSRWLANSLAEHYPALATPPSPGTILPSPPTDGVGDQAGPSDYLEKIFQVPFWLEPLGSTARKSLVRGLLQGNLAPAADGQPGNGEVEPLAFSGDADSMVHAMFGQTRAVRLETASLSVTPSELTFLDELAPLLGETPRSIKRFVNVYQLLCALPVPPELGSPRYEEAMGFLLAIADGLPSLYLALRAELERQPRVGTLANAIDRARPRVPETEQARYDQWAAAHPVVVGTPIEQLAEAAHRVHRFTFRD